MILFKAELEYVGPNNRNKPAEKLSRVFDADTVEAAENFALFIAKNRENSSLLLHSIQIPHISGNYQTGEPFISGYQTVLLAEWDIDNTGTPTRIL